jgi:Ca2+-transporting ATPase
MAFATLVLGNLSLVLANRSWTSTLVYSLRSPTPALAAVVLGGLVFLALVLYVPFLRDLFQFAVLSPADLALALAAGALGVGWLEALKFFTRTRSLAPSD